MSKTKLKDIASFSKGQQINGDQLLVDGIYEYLNGGINPSGKWSSFNVCGDTIAISEGGNSCGYVNYMAHDFWCGGHCYYLYDVKCLTKYLYYALKSQQDRIMKLRSGACMPNIKKKDLGDFVFEYNDNPVEQEKAIKIFDLFESVISYKTQHIKKLDELIKSRFVEMFGDCKTNPKNWKTVPIENIANVGSSKRVFVDELKNEGIPFFRGTEVGALAESKSIHPELFITEEHYQKLINESGQPKRGDLLMPSICPDGRIWLVDTDRPFYFKDGRVLWIHNIIPTINPTFLLYTLKDRIMTDYSSIASGTTFAELKIFSLKKCKIFDVSLDLQNKFESFILSVNHQKAIVQKSIEKLETLKKSLMQEYF